MVLLIWGGGARPQEKKRLNKEGFLERFHLRVISVKLRQRTPYQDTRTYKLWASVARPV